MKKKCSSFLFFLIAGVLLIACGFRLYLGVSDESEDMLSSYKKLDAITLIAADSAEKGAVGQLFGELVAQKASEITGGQLKIVYQPNGALGNDEELLQKLKNDEIQMMVCQPAPIVSLVPEMAVFDLPMVFSKYNGDTIDRVLNGENSAFHVQLKEAYDKADLHLLGILQNATYRLTTSNRPLSSLADFENLKIRSMNNDNHIAFWKAIGADPVPMKWSKVYASLEKGTILAQENAADTIVGAHIDKVQSTLSCTNHILYANQICMSKQSYEQLDPLYQDAIDQAVAEAMEEIRPQLADIDANNKQILKKRGMQIVEYNKDFYDKVLSLNSVKSLCEDINRQTNGLGEILFHELSESSY